MSTINNFNNKDNTFCNITDNPNRPQLNDQELLNRASIAANVSYTTESTKRSNLIVSDSSILVTAQVKFRADLIGRESSQYYSNNQNSTANYNGQIFPHNYSLLQIPQSPVLNKYSRCFANCRNHKYQQCFRSRYHHQHFKRKISSKWNNSSTTTNINNSNNNDTASSLSSSSGPARSCPTIEGDKSLHNSNENIVNFLSVENIPKLSLKSDSLSINMNINEENGIKENFQTNSISTKDIGDKHSPNSIQDDNHSTTKSDISAIAPCKGIVNLTIICQFSRITVLLKEAQNLRCQSYLYSQHNHQQQHPQSQPQSQPQQQQQLQKLSNSNLRIICNPFVRIQLTSPYPNGPYTPLFDTEVFPNSSGPIFDKSFTFNISQLDYHKRIFISVCHVQESEIELLGCMSFGIKKFITKTQVSGWYYLLRYEIGQRKHLKAGNLTVNRIRSVSGSGGGTEALSPTSVGSGSICGSAGLAISGNCSVNSANLSIVSSGDTGANHVSVTTTCCQTAFSNDIPIVTACQTYEVKMNKGVRGFGFTLCGGSPVYVSHVDVDSSAEAAGIHPGDMIMYIDNFNVSQSSTETVVRMFRMCPKTVKVTLLRTPSQFTNKPVSIPRPLPIPGAPGSTCPGIPASYTLPCISSVNQLSVSAATTSQPLGITIPPSVRANVYFRNGGVNDYQEQTGESNCGPGIADNLTSISEPAWNFKNHKSGIRGESKSVHFIQDITNSSKNNHNNHTKALFQARPSVPRSRAPSEGRQHPLPTLPPPANATTPTTANSQTLDVVDRLQYQGHLRKVDFNHMSRSLEVSGQLNLKEGNTLFPVHIYLFPQVILIGQPEPDGHITIIKEPIYCSKICYVNIPAMKKDELILQYINEVGRKQFVHFQAWNIREWLRHIQRHMIYHCNWWMTNIA